MLASTATAPPDASFDYLLDLRERDLVARARRARETKIAEMRARLADVLDRLENEQPFAGSSEWLAEIEAVARAVTRGEMTNWRFQ